MTTWTARYAGAQIAPELAGCLVEVLYVQLPCPGSLTPVLGIIPGSAERVPVAVVEVYIRDTQRQTHRVENARLRGRVIAYLPTFFAAEVA